MDLSYKVHCILISSQLTQRAEETLQSLKEQDYENLDISRADISGQHNPALKNNFSAAANLVLEQSTDNSSEPDYFLFVKEGVLLASTAVSELVSHAQDFDAGIVGPKLLSKANPRHILGAGIQVDKTGAAVRRILSKELDQGQHDNPGQVFAVQADCMLIRRDLFFTLKGFDKSMPRTSQDIDLCWRAWLAGSSVIIAPSSVCAIEPQRDTDASQFSFPGYRCQLRMMLANYGIFHLLRILPQALFVALLGLIWSLITLAPRKTGYILEAWLWNLFRAGSIFIKRHSVKVVRKRTDRGIRGLQEKGFAPLVLYFRDTEEHYVGLKNFMAGKGVWAAWLGILAVFSFGSRHLITRSIPVVGELLPFQNNFFDNSLSSYQSSGLGFDGLSPGAEIWLGLVDLIFFGFSGLARTAFIMSLFILGGLGIWNLLEKLAKAPAARALSAAVYLALPLPYIALRNGDLETLVLFAAAPWILSLLLDRKNFWLQSVVLGLVLGLATAFSVTVFLLLGFLVFGCVLSGFLTGIINLKPLGRGIVGGALGVLLNFSFNMSLGVQLFEWRPASLGKLELWELMIFDLSQISAGFLVWAALGAAAVLLLLARGQTSVWMTYAWVFYLGGIVLAWMGEQDFHRVASPEVLLIPSALGLAMALGLGAEIKEQTHNHLKDHLKAGIFIHWRKIMVGAAGLAILAGAVPILALSLDGRWDLPGKDHQITLNSIEESSQRVVWIGHPDILGTGSWQLTDKLAFSITAGSVPSIEQKWLRPKDESIKFLEAELKKLSGINRLGGRLALFGVSHIVLMEQPYPGAQKSIPISSDTHSEFEEQIDLRRLDTRAGITVYENIEAIPSRAVLPEGALESFTLNPSVALEVFNDTSREADFPVGDFYLADAGQNWNFKINGRKIESVQVLGWASLYPQAEIYSGLEPGEAVEATLEYKTKDSRRMFLAAQILLWIVFLFLAIQLYRQRNRNNAEREEL